MSVRSPNAVPHTERDLTSRPGGLAHAFALATLAAAVPLLFFGGTVTTLHAGLAIDGWLVLEPGRGDWFLWAYPIEQWFRDVGTFVEHTHRLLGSLVGLLAVATVIAAYWRDRESGAWRIACIALAGVVAQGVLGGLRVLEKSEELAFLHGAFGQLVFALLGATAIATSSAWRSAPVLAPDRAKRLRRASIAAAAIVYAQIAVGAWLRHGGSPLALSIHVVLVLAVIGAAMVLARELATAEAPRAPLRSARTALLGALAVQLVLGLLAFLSVYVVVGKNPTSVGQSLFPTLHVMCGAALLLACVASLMWSLRLARASRTELAVHAGRPQAVVAPALGEIEATR
jgi:cytochrome c oxidase assembly protein subunit 15